MSTRILHVSDLHVGAREPEPGDALPAEVVERIAPELVIASGDLTHRGRRSQHEAAAQALRGLGLPLLTVPGNHDIPHAFPSRFTHPWAEFERQWEATEQVFASASLQVVGINSVRPWRHQSGGLGRVALDRAAARLNEATPGAFRVAVLHHQLIGAPWRTRKRPVARRNDVLVALANAGANLILSGHIHQATVATRHEFELPEGAPGMTVSVAPGLGRPRPHRRGEARGFMVYEIDEQALHVQSHIRIGEEWRIVAERSFPRA